MNFDDKQKTAPITEDEAACILNIFNKYDAIVYNAFILTEVDSFGDTYIDMFVHVNFPKTQALNELNAELKNLHALYDIQFDCYSSNHGKLGTTYQFFHYFID